MVTQGFAATLVALTLAISRSSLYYRKKLRGSRTGLFQTDAKCLCCIISCN